MKHVSGWLIASSVLAFSSTLFGQFDGEQRENVGIGFEFGVNYAVDMDGEDGASHLFNLDFRLSDDLRVGLYREEIVFDGADDVDLTAIQIRHNITDLLDAGVRFGRNDGPNGGVYAGVFGSVTAISHASDTFHGDLNINLGYDFLPDRDDDLFKIGISSVIRF